MKWRERVGRTFGSRRPASFAFTEQEVAKRDWLIVDIYSTASSGHEIEWARSRCVGNHEDDMEEYPQYRNIRGVQYTLEYLHRCFLISIYRHKIVLYTTWGFIYICLSIMFYLAYFSSSILTHPILCFLVPTTRPGKTKWSNKHQAIQGNKAPELLTIDQRMVFDVGMATTWEVGPILYQKPTKECLTIPITFTNEM